MLGLIYIAWVCLCVTGIFGYMPGHYPAEKENGQVFQAEVTKITSQKTEIPKDYYRADMPFCRPKEGVHYKKDNVNLGTILLGYKPHNMPYNFIVMKDEKNVKACFGTEEDGIELTDGQVKVLKNLIDKSYRVSMNLDNMPVTTQALDQHDGSWVRPGYDIGFTKKSESEAEEAENTYCIYNHLSFTIQAHNTHGSIEQQQESALESQQAIQAAEGGRRLLEHTGSIDLEASDVELAELINNVGRRILADAVKDTWAVVGFEVRPLSHKWESKEAITPDALVDATGCQEVKTGEKVLYTYDVKWEKSDIDWVSRWDHYLQAPPNLQKIHWINILNSVLILLVMMVIVAMILLRTVRRDLAQYEEFLGDDKEETGWKMVAGDAFRAPARPMLFSVMVGTGYQIMLTSVVTMCCGAIGFLSPEIRGMVLTTLLVLYVLLAITAGFGAVRVWGTIRRNFDGWTAVCLRTACFFPGITLCILTQLNLLLLTTKTTGAVPLSTYFLFFVLWFVISIPMTYLGGYLATNRVIQDLPVRINQIPRHVPTAPFLANPWVLFIASGLLPFGTVYIELFFAMTKVWQGYFYHLFGFLFLVSLLTILITVEVAVLCTYVQLCAEDYHWWWRSFNRGGSISIHVFIYSIIFLIYSLKNMSGFLSIWLYLSYMLMVVSGLYLSLGAVGFASSYYFVRAILSTVKAD